MRITATPVRTSTASSAVIDGSSTRSVTLRSRCGDRVIDWGEPWHLGSPAYWVAQVGHHPDQSDPRRHALGRTLREELAACILGGHGVPAAVGLAAFRALRDHGMLEEGLTPPASQLEQVLRSRVVVNGRHVCYRFSAQRARRLSAVLGVLSREQPPDEALQLRSWLLTLPGVGPKTASWVVRNHCGSGDVAIIDIHVLRAGAWARVYDASWTPARHYGVLEDLFIEWARHGGVSAADLDAAIWAGMARLGRAAERTFGPADPQRSPLNVC